MEFFVSLSMRISTVSEGRNTHKKFANSSATLLPDTAAAEQERAAPRGGRQLHQHRDAERHHVAVGPVLPQGEEEGGEPVRGELELSAAGLTAHDQMRGLWAKCIPWPKDIWK